MQCIDLRKWSNSADVGGGMEIDSELGMPESFLVILVAVPVVLFSIDIIFHQSCNYHN